MKKKPYIMKGVMTTRAGNPSSRNSYSARSKTCKFFQARDLRHDGNPAEKAMYDVLQRFRAFGVWFNKSVVLYGYIADFICPAPHRKIVVEVDGSTHLTPTQRIYDRRRDVALKTHGFTTLRFPADGHATTGPRIPTDRVIPKFSTADAPSPADRGNLT